ncbi:hypothetical protein [Bacillus alkalicellulosilyticus]|uniref:hypothetical protein n=1 Tax=Alkalihalobacterium alkalicellulosilyticum TaxID=1912214 RepID=UPI000998A6ED|nr:hypothetical protein [Bacillus alkalicellulosilyticus]
MGNMNLQKRRFLSFFPTEVIVDERENGEAEQLYALSDNQGIIFTKDEILPYLEKVMKFYQMSEMDEWIKKENIKQEFYTFISSQTHLSFPEHGEDKYGLPYPQYRQKSFSSERNWSCKCEWCGIRVSSKEKEFYYTLNDSTLNLGIERACSTDCATLIWKEAARNFVYARGWQDFFCID